MAKLSVVVTRGLRSREVEDTLRALGQHLEMDKPGWLHRASAGPALTEFVELIGSAAAWLPLTAAASFYFSTLAKHAGDATWEGLRSLFKSKEVKPLADVSDALASITQTTESRVEIDVGLNIPSENITTRVTIRSTNPEEIARQIAVFVVRAEALATVINAEINAGEEPIGHVRVEVKQDCSLVIKWHSSPDGKLNERRMP